MARAARLIALAAVVVAVGAGCVRVRSSVVVEEDGSGSIEMISAVDPGAIEGLAELGLDDVEGLEDFDGLGGLDLCAAITDVVVPERDLDLLDDVEIEPYDEDGYCGARVTATFADIDALNASVLSEVFGDAAGVTHDGEDWAFEASFDSPDLAGYGENAPMRQMMTGILLDQADLALSMKLPGELGDHNAYEVASDGTVTWTLGIDEPATLFAEYSTGDATAVGVSEIIALAIAGVSVLAVLALIATRPRSST